MAHGSAERFDFNAWRGILVLLRVHAIATSLLLQQCKNNLQHGL